MDLDSTIAAVSTPPGEGGIGIVRISGSMALKIASSIFTPAENASDIRKASSHTVHYGHIISDGETIDEVLVNVMRSPRTYTREDVVEINCHGGIIPLKRTLSLLIENGARLAEPGEFTWRAFLNGRIDLTQAEAVADIISAKTEIAGKIAMSHLKGAIKQEVERLSSKITEILAEVEASIEFPDDVSLPEISDKIVYETSVLTQNVQRLLAGADAGVILRDGLQICIVGRPNVGKSSLFNALSGENRVIVTPVSGTTRDIIDCMLNIDGIPVNLSDTAGLNEESSDAIEREAVARSLARTDKADMLIMTVDGSAGLLRDDLEILKKLKGKPVLIAVNKADLPSRVDATQEQKMAEQAAGIFSTSAATGAGIEELRRMISGLIWQGSFKNSESVLISNRRHAAALKEALQFLLEAKESALRAEQEISSLNLKKALRALGQISGQTADDGVLSTIFMKFCIGK